ncbi:MAG: anthranilate phosphoribosyltransferase [Acidimicrobiia bacterium]|nr:anthranilate phosphoribosyltransferase [Acidimicrobiia bacterium]MYG59017.1 anthranilate phosphoribosyltransferase [Acidimicrobiia bacterium]MYJ33151.1 anthranilate phosphoribosyltransferase [Acidimicrobiia bacterium]
MSLDQYGGWAGIFRRLTGGDSLTADAANAAMTEILNGDATPAQIAGFVIALRTRGETSEELVGLLSAMRAAAETVPVDVAGLGLIDTCGTGGDNSGSINVSTAAALVAVGAGARVCKHGNRSASSQCGSADVLEALGAVIDLGPEGVARCVTETGFGFCLAPRFHPAMRHAGPARRELAVATVFNFLGPLANPAGVKRQLVGVSDRAMAETMLEVLAATGSERAMIVHGQDGLDELSTTGPTDVWELRDGDLHRHTVDPSDLGLAPASAEDLVGGDAAVNADFLRRVLDGQPGAHRDIVILNAAAALVVADVSDSLEDGLEAAAASIDSGRAGQALDVFVAASNEAAAEEERA